MWNEEKLRSWWPSGSGINLKALTRWRKNTKSPWRFLFSHKFRRTGNTRSDKRMFWTEFTWRLLNTENQRKTLCFCTVKEETFAVLLNREILAFRGHKLSRMTKIWTFREENKIKIFRGHKLLRMSYFEKLCGHKPSRKGPETEKPQNFLSAKLSSLKVINHET